MTRAIRSSVSVVLVLVLLNIVNSEPPVQNAQQNSGGWGNSQQQASGGYSGGQSNSGGYSNGGAQNGGGGWGQQQQQQPQQDGRNGGGWGQQQQQQQNSGGDNGGGWGQGQQQQQQQNGNGWGMDQNQMQKDQGNNNGWGPQLNFEVDTANLKGFNPFKILKSIAGIPRKIINFIRESGLYILFIPLLIILPLLLLAFNFGKLIGGFGGWGWGRSLTTVENGIVGYLKSPAWQKVAETLMDEHVFDRVMKSLEEFRKDWKTSGQVTDVRGSSD